MKDNSPLNLECDFAPEIVDYIYGEMSGERGKVFSDHLLNCTDCTDEVTAFSGIKFSIGDWKTAEFDKLATPQIEIPYKLPAVTTATEKQISWLDAVRGFFTLSPVMTGAAAVLLLGLFIGLAFFINGRKESQFVAENEPKDIKRAAVVQSAETVEDSNLKNIKTVDEATKPDSEMNHQTRQAPVSTEIKPVEAKKVITVQRVKPVKTAIRNQTPNIPADENVAKVSPKPKKPRLNEIPEETEDDGLRLTDLFAELDAK